ncbi:receptor-like protein kinase FERONIA [Primulina eburnea]|uniref:receptor-like protein kinase FERONIA n=1 Tax=Primulina eburnea TaxID=1245227 RepID=UPI003C6C4231
MKTIISFLLLLLHFIAAVAAQYNATDYILLDCGAPFKQTDENERSWDSDERSKYEPPEATAISISSKASQQHPSVTQVPYLTARVFTSNFTYTFPLLAGPKFLRLYFYPSMFSGYNGSESFFTVTANGFVLMTNFSVSLNSDPSNPAFIKEFIFNVDSNQRLNLTFIPNPESFAFVNGIEIVSVPEKLYFRGNDEPLKTSTRVFYLRSDTALENLYRLNVGGSDIEVQNDTGMFRAWNQDDNYIFGVDYGYTPHEDNASIKYNSRTPAYTAPENVYTTARVTGNTSVSLEWAFPVDSGFNYLLRLHFCEIQQEVTKQNQRVFTISINNETVEIQADIISWTGGNDIPIFMDYVAWVPDDGRRGMKDLRLSLTPDKLTQPEYYSAVLNGLEIFKISDSYRSLAAANPEPSEDQLTPKAETNPVTKKRKSSPLIYAIIASVIAATVVAAVVSFLIFRRRRRVKDSVHASFPKSSWVPLSTASRSTTKTTGSGFSLPSDLCRHFLLEEIKSATNNFDDTYVIGKGGFGNVYKGYTDTAGSNAGATVTAVAIKRLNPSSNQGAREFQTEIEMLSKLRHLHLVSLIGYCDENGEMILVYDYMSHGTLREHLYNSENPPLKWIDRLKICIGAAKGLHYLHTGTKYPIIHRDVKSTNILLDEKWVAKVSDFGLSKVGPTGDGPSHVSTVVKGSFGYVDPEYYQRRQLTDKSDVYSFGVVLVEVLCGRPAILQNLPREQMNLAEWAQSCYKKGIVDKIIDPNLRGGISSASLNKYIETAMICLMDKGIERPVMSDVLWSLEFALQRQEEAENDGGGGGGQFFKLSPLYPLMKNGEANTTDEEEIFSGGDQNVSGSKSTNLFTDSSERLKSGDVFSEIKNPLGR